MLKKFQSWREKKEKRSLDIFCKKCVCTANINIYKLIKQTYNNEIISNFYSFN